MKYKYIIESKKGILSKEVKPSLPGTAKGLKLNLGCGRKHIIDYINIDIQEPCDLKCDLRQPLPFTDNSVDEVFTEDNTITVFTQKEWKKLKKEIVRVLKPGGKFEAVFMDFEYSLKAFMENKDGNRWNWWLKTIYGYQENEFDLSKNAFTPEKFVADMKEEGMENFEVKKLDNGYVNVSAFKKLMIALAAFLLIVPRVAWADFSYIATDISPESDSPDPAFLMSYPKKKKKVFVNLPFMQEASQFLQKFRYPIHYQVG